ncbi:MAG: hypothetical protein AAGK17_00805 [Pseudomonadota bacterium]
MKLWSAGLAVCSLLHCTAAWGQVQASGNVEVAVDEDGWSRSALLVVPKWSASIDDDAEAVLSFRVEGAASETGLGTTSSFSPISEPLIGGDDFRVSIEEAFVELGSDNVDVILGKQNVAWGSLDGIRITDKVNPERRTEFLAREPRPDRIPIWAARVKLRAGDFDLDIVGAPDPTVNQVPQVGSTFFPTAPRLLGGLMPVGQFPAIIRQDRGRLFEDGVVAARASIRASSLDLRVSAISAPDRDGIVSFDGQSINILHPRTHSFGLEAVWQTGNVVLRLDSAWTPDAVHVLDQTFATQSTKADQIVAGIGADIDGPFESFINIQVIADHVASDQTLVRPKTDIFSSLRIQKQIANGDVGLKIEAINSWTGEGHLLRAEMERRLSDNFDLYFGVDAFFGSEDELIGQFERRSRVKAGVRFAF